MPPFFSNVNVGQRLAATACDNPEGVAVAAALPRRGAGPRKYQVRTFAELDQDSNLLAEGLQAHGARRGMRLVLLVKPGVDFISLVFAMFKAGVVTVLIDPGMGRSHLIRCLEEAEPEGFVAISPVQAVRTLLRHRFPKARLNVTVGRRWFWGGPTLAGLRKRTPGAFQAAATKANDEAAIIFTTGSTGPPKGVLFHHGVFDRQADEIRDFYGIAPGEIDLSGFPLFALFNCAMGVTTVVPEMDFTRPADVDPRNILAAARDWKCTQAFGSPALWNSVGRYCQEHDEHLPDLKRVLTAGAPAPPHVLRRVKQIMPPDGEMHTPYGATESLPVASISASEVLGETAAQTEQGAGTCVGRRFPGIDWKVIRIRDEPIPQIDQIEELPAGQIGEIVVTGPVVTRRYVTRTEANAEHKIQDGDRVWHRIGDLGYFDEQERFWFCGRKAHRVITAEGTLYTVCCEAIFNNHPSIYRSALVGVGPRPNQRPVMICEPLPEHRPATEPARQQLIAELQALGSANPLTAGIHEVLLHDSMPVDIRHNAKIFREKLAVWAAKVIQK
ncbi:fatty acid CoA ligase family protein [Lignipirellula cremea]|uniref:Long-chain-fatty-acid--CoA ligase n=1 Tax=Lignipirellula cremea TaxID=2528010 RepID=A0A518E3Q0_9BACT|nr:fatty acid CoA ligase family protein [Lignipirellula cremea]QDU98717.1 Long-chain-fatty-acid--CoA ligase [Lignipirellula cremea]